MENKAFKKTLSLYTSLLELHGENPFKIRNLSGKIFNLDRLGIKLSEESVEAMEKHAGLGPKLASAIASIRETGSFPEMDELLSNTPKGVVKMLEIKGIGAKKVASLWKDLGVETIEDLQAAGQEGKIAKLSGFGEKTERLILESLEYQQEQAGKGLYAEWLVIAEEIEKEILKDFKGPLSRAGGLALGEEILSSLDWLVRSEDKENLSKSLEKIKGFKSNEVDSGPFVIRGSYLDMVPITMRFFESSNFGNQQLSFSSPPGFLELSIPEKEKTIGEVLKEEDFKKEEDFFSSIKISNIPSEMRSIKGVTKADFNQAEVLDYSDITGVLHAHSTYSDGQNSIEEMANATKERGYHYFGLSDHSKSAFYANGLDEDRIIQQHKEVDELNEKLSPFVIFKGIESDILNDGALDYSDEVLKSFDFIVASVHSNLNMDIDKATQRLVNAVENPYTTILGHPTGRLLLRREGYPIDHKKVIDACADNQVIIEINANPWRLDLDWKWVDYAQEKGVKISINPDAHAINGIDDIRYGVLCARKAGLRKENTFNAQPVSEIASWFKKKNG